MDYTVYFADKAVVFTAKTPGEGWYAVTPAPDGGISRAKVTKILESYNKAAVVTPDPGAAFGAFAAEFALIEAAGGVVVNDCGQWLMRHGSHDFIRLAFVRMLFHAEVFGLCVSTTSTW